MSARFVPALGNERRLAREPGVRRLTHSQAERLRDRASEIAPTGGTGDYAGSFRVGQHRGKTIVSTVDPAGHLGEFGSVNNPPYAPLRRAARSIGLKLEESPKT